MKILLVLARPLFPAHTGGQIRSFQIFSRLARRVEVHCISLADSARDAEAIREMEKHFASYTPVYWRETPKFSARFYAEFLAIRFGSLPYFLQKYCRSELRAAVEQKLAALGPAVLFCDFLHMAVALQDLAHRPRVVFQHNVEYVIRQRQWQTETRPLHKWLLDAEWKKAWAAEQAICRSFDHVFGVSEEDCRRMETEFAAQRTSVIATGVDADYFRSSGAEPRAGNLVFVGSMDWHPNEDGILWFTQEVLPRIRAQAPGVKLTVVGRNPSPAIQALAQRDSAIRITGTVPDVRPFLEEAVAVLVPLRIGGGTRIKIYEAMAAERAVVSTTIGAEGLPVTHGRDILLADSPEDFAAAVLSVLNDPSRRKQVAKSACEMVRQHHTWEMVVDRMKETLESLASSGSQRSAAFGEAGPAMAAAGRS